MILAASLLISMPQDIAPAEETPIVVIARKLGTWRGAFRVRDGVASCVTRKSTGDDQIDAVGCEALTICAQRNQAGMIAAADRKIPAPRRKEMQAASNQALIDCLESERPRLIGELADRRAASQGARQ